MLRKIISAAIFALILVPAGVAPAQEEEAVDETGVRIGIKREESKFVEVVTVPFSVQGKDTLGLGELAARIINFDLEFSGYFKPSSEKGFIRAIEGKDAESGEINFEGWRALSSNFLIKGKVIPQGSSQVTLEAVVYDLQAKQMSFGKRYTGKLTQFRQIVHQFSDDFVNMFTGEDGIGRSRILFVSMVRGRKELLISDYDGDNPRQVTTERTLVLSPSWNWVNKNLVLFTTYRYRNPDLYAMDLGTKDRYPLSTVIGVNSTGQWSPDGTRVAFTLTRRGNADVYIVNADGRGMVRLTDDRSMELNPSWSPDGKRIAFTSDRSGSPQIYIMNSNGTGRERFSLNSRYADGATWSPKGDFISYASQVYDHFDIALQHVGERSASLLTEGYGMMDCESPSWAPNGRHLVFSSNKSGGRQLYITSLTGSEPWKITDLPGQASQPSWGPN